MSRWRERLVRSASRFPALLDKASTFCNDAQLVGWMESRGMSGGKIVSRREELYSIVADDIGDQPVCYLEFGVAAGDALRIWSRLLTHPDSVLHGFDTFEGLPETWTSDEPKGKYSQGGQPPSIADDRVTFHKGLFDQTLPAFSPPERDHYVLNLDADLYSSTIYVLRAMRHVIRPGTYLYFDEFASRGHEERAWREFVDESGLQFDLVGASEYRWHMLFRCRAA